MTFLFINSYFKPGKSGIMDVKKKKDLMESLSYYNILKNLIEIEENSTARKQKFTKPSSFFASDWA